MRKVLIVSPRFPPINAPDMHRVRLSISYLEEMGWQSEVWQVNPAMVNREHDAMLLQTVPHDVPVLSVDALNPAWTRIIGVGSVALRSFPFYMRALHQRLSKGDIDLIYFSTTAFPVLVLGRYLKRVFGVPYIFDIQDPWHLEYYLDKPPSERPPKFWPVYYLHRFLEMVAMRRVDRIIAVSQGYCEALCQRYEWITPEMCHVIPFGAARGDFEVMEASGVRQSLFDPAGEAINIVYAGRGGHDMTTAARAIFGALARGRSEGSEIFQRVRMFFVGTSYAPAGEGDKTFEPIADHFGVADVVVEHTARIPYFESLRLLRDADMLIVPGSIDSAYTASKLYPYILAERPILSVFHQDSSVVDILRKTRAGTAVTFNDNMRDEQLCLHVYQQWKTMLQRLPEAPQTDWDAFAPYTAKEMTRRQVEVFDAVVPPNIIAALTA